MPDIENSAPLDEIKEEELSDDALAGVSGGSVQLQQQMAQLDAVFNSQ
jgi:hypothetical protein